MHANNKHKHITKFTMNYFQKNRTNIIIGVIATLLVAALIALWLQRKTLNSPGDIVAEVYPKTVNVKDSLFFVDKTPFAKSIRWDFDDGSTSDKPNGVHFYSKPGYYQVTLMIDNKYSKMYGVLVSEKQIAKKDSMQSFTKIDAFTQARQFENVQFKAISDAKQFTWRFGETGNIDSKDKLAFYTYQKPGDYIVTLYTEENTAPVQHHIKIIPAYNELDDAELKIDDHYAQVDNDFKYRLQQIANGNSFNLNYNYLLNKYLCNNENATVSVNESKINNFYLYCAGLQFDKNTVIQTVKLNFDEKQNCVTKVEINQTK